MRQGIVLKVVMLIFLCITLTMIFSGCRGNSGKGKLVISIYYADNATLPFRQDWLTIQKVQEMYNVKINWEVIPLADYQTKVSLALNTGINAPDAILYQSIAGENVSLAMNGAIVPIGDYSEWTPHCNAWIAELGLQEDVDMQRLKDGKLYGLPRLYDMPFYDGGLLLREDVLKKYGLSEPKTYDDLYNILSLYKKDNPSSYPMTILAGPRVHYRMTQPAWGISVHRDGAGGGSRILSWDYDKKEFFPAAISEQYRDYMRFWSKCFAEGLLDPEMADPINGDVWTRKMATGAAIATYAYYDQIGGVTAASAIPGFKLQMYPPLEGPAGAYSAAKSRVGGGVLFPIATSRRSDFERVVRTVDEIFYSKEAALLWCLGVEGVTYTMEDEKVVFSDSILSSSDGVYKVMQLRYGAGVDCTQVVWINEREMLKYDENYAEINRRVAGMPDAIRYVPPIPRFDVINSEKAASLVSPLFDTFTVWDNAFLTGSRNLDRDWNAYVAEMTSKGINDLLILFNNNK